MEKMLVLAVAIGGVLVFDGFALKRKLSAGGKLVYGILIAMSLYTGIDYFVNLDWPDYFDLADAVFGQLSKSVEQSLKVNWER
ncbi:hypothetical protein RB620_09465 [Paenibacillus sp. LHD-117]|uniref:hypothetical protein n=1 Tax=Paenibacillus sp. LHD-117 TaxID=3071412 RepID=UPI0027DEABD3|nr:hypothetical protein [Paenibacillus sp. LHD-117]MDQ6419658.1 hypothetical protein [Paenibacillus sp. LHD-117]